RKLVAPVTQKLQFRRSGTGPVGRIERQQVRPVGRQRPQVDRAQVEREHADRGDRGSRFQHVGRLSDRPGPPESGQYPGRMASRSLPARAVEAFTARRRLVLALQIAFAVVVVGSFAWAARGSWHDAADDLRSADRVDLLLALLAIAAYYLAFVIGWRLIL